MTNPAQPVRKRRTWLIVVIAVPLVLAAVCVFGMIRLYLGVKGVTDKESAAKQATTDYIEAAKNGIDQAEYDTFCAEAKEEYRLQDVAAPQPVAGYRILDAAMEYERGQATVSVEIKHPDGATSVESYIVNEDKQEQWRICGFPNLAK
ncbi:hypothetical protein AB0M54_13790 [Actinoplanes sp. NPDC051470]|uniref:hypothetical protein n=1 Tax=unclassified Actinoplanes TaxID=2626549 RepID=UPI003417A488